MNWQTSWTGKSGVTEKSVPNIGKILVQRPRFSRTPATPSAAAVPATAEPESVPSIGELLAPDRIAVHYPGTSKKRALQEVAERLAQDTRAIGPNDVFDVLINRERLGSTGMGHGVAIPHGRMETCHHTLGAFVTLDHGVDFEAVDDQPVDLLFGLLVPEACTDRHLKILAQIAERFRDPGLRRRLRDSGSADEVYRLLQPPDGQS